uniref:Methyltransferase FkbM domain-containing protein n=1 Tax=Meloidogyne enterolobii TaxID=390850 RepID=A0A6V7U1G0_MELEN|nr:unnamed protein product [Meloidogyne enterolobii]
MTNLRKEIYVILAILMLIILYVHKNKINFIWNTGKGTKFLNAFNKQRQGLIMVRYANSSKANYEATLANIPIQFNAIWQEQFNSLNPIGLHAADEIKYFLRFNNPTSTNYECNVVTMVADVNAELVEKQLNGTFVERVITAEDSYTANLKLNTIWNTQGKSQFDNNFNEISIGFFDFFQYYNAKPVIDLLIIDIEGSEFAIFQLLAEQYEHLPVTVCQMNIEFHNQPLYGSFFIRHRFFRNFDWFIRHGRFALMKTDSINVADSINVTKKLYIS